VRFGTQIVASAVEHSAILHAVTELSDDPSVPWSSALLSVDSSGQINADECRDALNTTPTAFAAVQWANGEVASRQPLAEVASFLGDVPLLMDGTAGLGYDDLTQVPWSVLTAGAAHLGAPASCAVVVIREGVRWRAIDSPTDAYEHGVVPGLPNIAAICGLAAAVAQAHENRTAESQRQRALTEAIRAHVSRSIKDSIVLGAQGDCIPHTVTMSFLYVSGAALAAELDAAGFAVASGSACSSDALTPSHVLAAMGALTEGNIRVSLPPDATDSQVAQFLVVLEQCVARVRAKFGAPA
jgi:cysteine desulfurase